MSEIVRSGEGSPSVVPFGNDEFRLEFVADGRSYRVRAPGVAKALGFRSARDMLRTVPDDEKGVEIAPTLGGDQRSGYLTETGFNRVVGQRQAKRVGDESVRGQVQRFQKWVFGEVLPALRRGELVPAPSSSALDIPDDEKALLLAHALIKAGEEKRALTVALSEATNRAEVTEAALEAAAPALEYIERYIDPSQVTTVKKWAAQFNLSEPEAYDLLKRKRIVYKEQVGWRWSGSKNRMVEELEYRAYRGKPSFDWFDLRPQHNAPTIHNGQVRTTLYVRQAFALDLGRLVGLSQPTIPGSAVALREMSGGAA